MNALIQADKCGEHGAVLVVVDEAPVLASLVEVTGIDTVHLSLSVNKGLKLPVNLALKKIQL